MWILAVTLGVLVYVVVRQYARITQLRVALAVYATDLLLRPEVHRASAASLRDLILRGPRDRLSTEKEVFRAIHQWALEATAARSGVTLQSIVART
jgi:hypothetical protein